MRIALDAMGGDYAPQNTVAGAVMALREYSTITRLYLTGDEKAIRAELAKMDFHGDTLAQDSQGWKGW